jgi:O-methyltransferase involved in polyketide biosynthesis
VEILDTLDYDPKKAKLVSISQIGVCLRTIIFDEQVVKFLQAYPDGIVVNLGCGLDTRFTRLDNGTVQWFDLDLPEVMISENLFSLKPTVTSLCVISP